MTILTWERIPKGWALHKDGGKIYIAKDDGVWKMGVALDDLFALPNQPHNINNARLVLLDHLQREEIAKLDKLKAEIKLYGDTIQLEQGDV